MNRETDRKKGRNKKWIKRHKRCYFSDNSIVWIDYKNEELLSKFINNQGKIQAASYTGTKRKFQRKLSIAIKRARHIGILPFTAVSVITLKKNEDKKNRLDINEKKIME